MSTSTQKTVPAIIPAPTDSTRPPGVGPNTPANSILAQPNLLVRTEISRSKRGILARFQHSVISRPVSSSIPRTEFISSPKLRHTSQSKLRSRSTANRLSSARSKHSFVRSSTYGSNNASYVPVFDLAQGFSSTAFPTCWASKPVGRTGSITRNKPYRQLVVFSRLCLAAEFVHLLSQRLPPGTNIESRSKFRQLR